MSFAEYSTALVEEVRRSTPANASCIISAEAAEEWLTHFWVAAAADEDDGRAAPPPIPYKLARVVVHGTGAAGAAGIAAHGGPARRADGLAGRGAAAAARRRPHRLHDVRRPRPDVRLRARGRALHEGGVGVAPARPRLRGGERRRCGVLHESAEGGAPVRRARDSRCDHSAILGAAARNFAWRSDCPSLARRLFKGTSCASRSPMRPTT